MPSSGHMYPELSNDKQELLDKYEHPSGRASPITTSPGGTATWRDSQDGLHQYGTFPDAIRASQRSLNLKMPTQTQSTVNLFLSVLVITFGSNFQIYNTGVVNNVQYVVQEWVNQSFIERYGKQLGELDLDVLFSIAASSNLLGAMLGAALTRTVAEGLGRRKGLMLNSLMNICGCLLTSLAKTGNSYEMLLVGRLLIGVTVGLGFGIAGMYLTEMPPVKYRGTTGTVQQMFVGFSDFFALAVTLHILLGTAELWPYAFGLPIIPSALQFLYLLFYCHDSPRYLYITQGDIKGAVKSVLFFQGPQNLDQTLADLKVEAESTKRAKKKNIGLKEMFSQHQYRRPLIIAAAVMSATTMSGITPVMSYSTDMFVDMSIDLKTSMMATVGVGFCNFAVPFFIIFIIDKVGRRILFLTMLWGCLISLSALSAFSFLADEYQYPWAGPCAIASLVVYQISFAIGAPVSWIIASELFETHTRSFATSITGLLFWFLSMVTVFAYLPFKQFVGVALSFLPFIICLVIAVIFLTSALPETKGRTIDNIVAQWRRPSRFTSICSSVITKTIGYRSRPESVVAGSGPILHESGESAYCSGTHN